MAAASAWLAARAPSPSRSYFLWVHLYDAHDPYRPPAPFGDRVRTAPYDGEIAFQDLLVGELLTRAGYGTPATPLVVVAGDHGESLGEHGESTHGLFVYEGALRVPLIVSWPGVLGPRVATPVVSLVDVAPTLTALAGLAPLEGSEGRSLEPLVAGDGADAGEPGAAYAETYFPQYFMGWAPLRTVRDGSWKFIDAPEPELYDLARDPAERTNVYATEPATARALRRTLETMARAAPDRANPAAMSADARQRLSSLGYVSTAATPAAGVAAADPKQMVPLFERLLDGNRALSRGQPDLAVTIAREVLAEDGGNAFARLVLGRGLLAAGRPREAIEALRTYVAAVPGSADAHHWIALAQLRLGDRAGALAEEDAALALDPRHGAAIALRAGLLFSSGRKAEGVQALRDAVTADPADVALRVSLADLLADAGLAAEAEPEYRRVLEAHPTDVPARVGLGLLFARTGRLEPALAELTRALEIDPGHDEARFERAVVHERLGRVAEARAGYQRLRAAGTRPDIRQAAEARLAGLGR